MRVWKKRNAGLLCPKVGTKQACQTFAKTFAKTKVEGERGV